MMEVTRVYALVFGALLMAGAQAPAAADPVPPERVVYRDLHGMVRDGETEEPVPGVVVSLLYETTTTDSAGNFVFEKVPLKHAASVSVRVRNSVGYIIGCMTLDVPAGFYPIAAVEGERLAVDIVEMANDEPITLWLQHVPTAEVSAYCQQCHRRNPCVETSTYSTITESGADLRGIIVDEEKIEEFTSELRKKGLRKGTYARIRYQDTHPKGIDLLGVVESYPRRYRMPETLEGLADDQEVTCDTCHSRHVPTAERQYVVMPFEDESNTLCNQCHQ